MLKIECVCGKGILLVPDLQAMGMAIRRHASTHRKEERERIEEHLVAEAFVTIASTDTRLWNKILAYPFSINK